MDIKDYIAQWCKLDYILPEDIPNIELYMDQVTTFMDQHFSNSKRYKDDKTLTKTMINNYTKNKLMPPPIKKKYSKNQIYLYDSKACPSPVDKYDHNEPHKRQLHIHARQKI